MGPPHGVDLFRYATASADIAEGDRSVAEVLAAHALSLEQWTEVSVYWAQRMSDEPRVLMTFSDAFTKAQDAKRPLPALTVEEWAALGREILVAGSSTEALSARGLSAADHMRLVRHWARLLASDPDLARAYEAALDDLDRGV